MELDIRQTTQTELDSKVDDFKVQADALDTAQISEVVHDNTNYSEYNGYYLDIPEYQSAINSFATWVLGLGWTSDPRNTAILDGVDGWGEDTFNSILWNMLVIKKIQGDAFAEIVRDDSGTIINIIPLGSLRIVTNKKGRVIRYEDRTQANIVKYEPNRILHLCNNRLANQIHGTATTRSIKWVIDAKNEAMNDWRRLSHRSTIRIMFVDEQDTTRLNNIKRDYAEAINKGELLIVPRAKVDDVQFEQLTLPPFQQFGDWIKYLDDQYYRALGVPKVILGGTAENTEASAKVSVIVFEPIFVREITDLKDDIKAQLGIEIEINKQPSLMDSMQTQEEKNPNQAGFQPNDVEAGVGK